MSKYNYQVTNQYVNTKHVDIFWVYASSFRVYDVSATTNTTVF